MATPLRSGKYLGPKISINKECVKPRSCEERRFGLSQTPRRVRADAPPARSPISSNRPNDGTWMYRLDRSEAWMPKRRGPNSPARRRILADFRAGTARYERRRTYSAVRTEERPQLVHKEFGLLEGREVAAPRHFVPVGNVPEARLHPGPYWGDDLLGKHRHTRRHINRKFRAALAEAFPVEPGRGSCGRRHPVQHDVVQEFVAAQDVLGMAIAIGPGPEFFQDPCRLACGRVAQAVA